MTQIAAGGLLLQRLRMHSSFLCDAQTSMVQRHRCFRASLPILLGSATLLLLLLLLLAVPHGPIFHADCADSLMSALGILQLTFYAPFN